MKITYLIALLGLTAVAVTGCGRSHGGITKKVTGSGTAVQKVKPASASGKILSADDTGNKYQVEFVVGTPSGEKVFRGAIASKDSQLLTIQGQSDLLRVDSYDDFLGTVILVHYGSEWAAKNGNEKEGSGDYGTAYSLKREGNDLKLMWTLSTGSARQIDAEYALKVDTYLKLNGLLSGDIYQNSMNALMVDARMTTDNLKVNMDTGVEYKRSEAPATSVSAPDLAP